MAEPPEASRIVTSINNITALVASLRSGTLHDLLRPGGDVADCTNNCECKTRYCGCDSVVASREWEELTYPEFLQMRERRIDELRGRLRALEEGPSELEGWPRESR
jgi:hypothetical protein